MAKKFGKKGVVCVVALLVTAALLAFVYLVMLSVSSGDDTEYAGDDFTEETEGEDDQFAGSPFDNSSRGSTISFNSTISRGSKSSKGNGGKEGKVADFSAEAIHFANIDGRSWAYTLDGDRATLWCGKDSRTGSPCVSPRPSGRVVVPGEIDGHRVVALGPLAFFGCTEMEEIVLPESLEVIGNRCFILCESLKEIDLPTNVHSVGIWAFNRCDNLQRANIANCTNITVQGVFAFCPKLEAFEVSPDNPVYKVEDGNLYSADGSRFIAIHGSATECLVAGGVVSVDDYAFCGSCIERVTLPSSVRHFGEGVFKGCKRLKSVLFTGPPPSVSSVQCMPFSGVGPGAMIEVRSENKAWRDRATGECIFEWPADRPGSALPVSYF